ncbi:Succinyl-diaminopimelate desuccinylase OS=Tsukamurella paurometabola (strain ATCC 8368 / DSM/ CCUG 35730 / CIP 100753 / JCM 10117 / KCTC 9821 / NBRC 16120/ NCIMB 702349 / NCTC 13040) OX=521096 GN=Tpau_1160 PE=4 SV=1 [Tsukamurella paurometabola]|uniref:Succinyl-diaminopimelate desuccinylase n=1 Tax=Tsukamurella paurometabola (strain ATCC 8368 / DSM 20162 / CCUG 35730 / CIP 100753 / JCM 10117 / KCTC 9821 / NBRC 16120 / NCIMB 702349 / NCTC 13040) TaxID=521096 RepID=D5UVY4_TSUPD|nr:succinyl-diaminopimelate desuccinylase [Tsukamurella paurometabola]ADG77791.1 succinyl-diaminopimelate desuccinylase [Tsukamurella paurometabola DSM 20162]SUP28769.1 Succinyl-diaminopimelate desuccinylase [Tsukamurella paurometabola]
MVTLELASDPIDLTAALVDIPSVSHDEERIADEVEAALRALDHYEVLRVGNNVLARTNRGLPQRVMLAGHLDTVPIADNVPSRREVRASEATGEAVDILHGCGTVDMKSGDAVFLHLAATLDDPAYDLTLIFYECEEISSEFNGLGRIERELPQWLRADVAILGEPSGGLIEAGCQGTIRVRITAGGVRAHSARSWLGDNAIHKLGPVLTALQAYTARTVDIDGCEYREGLSAVKIEGGVAGNVVPDEAFVDVNFRFAPDRTVDEAVAHVREVLAGPLADGALGFEVTDAAPGALPGLGAPAAAKLVEAAGGRFRAKYGWTDVSRFAALGIPAVNFGPGDPNYAHKRDEQVETAQITEVAAVLRAFLAG